VCEWGGQSFTRQQREETVRHSETFSVALTLSMSMNKKRMLPYVEKRERERERERMGESDDLE